jgi:hypothetical protein
MHGLGSSQKHGTAFLLSRPRPHLLLDKSNSDADAPKSPPPLHPPGPAAITHLRLMLREMVRTAWGESNSHVHASIQLPALDVHATTSSPTGFGPHDSAPPGTIPIRIRTALPLYLRKAKAPFQAHDDSTHTIRSGHRAFWHKTRQWYRYPRLPANRVRHHLAPTRGGQYSWP